MRVLFIGTGDIGVPTLRALLASNEHTLVGLGTQPDKPVGRAQEIRSPATKAFLLSANVNIPIFQPARIKATDAIEQLHSLAPDIIVVMAYGQILPRAVLEVPRLACLNLHASLLPRWRGASPIQAAIAAGDHETGITVMHMDEGLDTGDILLKKKIAIGPNETGGSLHDRLGEVAPAALLEGLELLESGNTPRWKQESDSATYAPKLERDAGKIDWTEQAEAIERRIRAYNPWPGAYTMVASTAGKEQKLKIFASSVVDTDGTPGQLLSSENGQMLVATGRSALFLREVQLEGRQRMSISDFLRGTRELRLV
jgi:methionyl-tRNA formyltransferase